MNAIAYSRERISRRSIPATRDRIARVGGRWSLTGTLLLMLCSCSDRDVNHVTTPAPVIGAIENNPAWNRAGDRVALFSYTDSLGDYAPGIYIVDSVGAGKRKVPGFGRAARWAADDSALIINDGERIFLQSLQDSSRTEFGLLPASAPFDVSVDGRYIFYSGQALDSANPSG